MYTVKCESWEGTYYLINHWNKHKRVFIEIIPYDKTMLFKNESDAKRSITKLLNGVMGEDYKNDKFTIIKIEEE